MGDHREQVVDISTPPSQAQSRVQEVQKWLKESGWALPGGDGDWLHSEASPFVVGSHASVAVNHPFEGSFVVVVPRPFVGGFDVAPGIGHTWDAGDGAGPPVCRACGADPDYERDWDVYELWMSSGIEPRLHCRSCGWEALVGDWNLEGSPIVGSLAVVIQAWDSPKVVSSELDPTVIAKQFRDEIRVALGGRWVYNHLHV